jgi:2-polyprenyl-3-methyl-5-hydroxy-6-metoxy-1,4-benzoquinol methylase
MIKVNPEYIRKRARSYWRQTFFHPSHSLDTTTVLKMKDKKLLEKIQEILDYREELYKYSDNMAWNKLKGRVLDFGCGSCPDGHYFLKNKLVEHLTIADIVPSNILISLRHLSLVSNKVTAFLWEKPDDLKYLNLYNIIYSGGVLHHMPDAKVIVNKLKNHLSCPDGIFIVMLYTYKLHPKISAYLGEIPKNAEGPYCRGYDEEDVNELFGDDMELDEMKTFYDGKYCRYIIRWKR